MPAKDQEVWKVNAKNGARGWRHPRAELLQRVRRRAEAESR